MTAHPTSILLIGRFPPPIDGQSLMTARLLNVLEEDYNVTTHNTSTASASAFSSKVFRYLGSRKRLAETIIANKPKVVVWTTISPHFSGHVRDFMTVLPETRRIPLVTIVHWGNFETLFTSLLTKWSSEKLVRLVTKFVFIDQTLADKCAEWIPNEKITVIPNILDSKTICSDREVAERRTGRPSRPFRILYLSNMIKSKGFLDVLEAGIILRENNIPFFMDFVGSWHDSSAEFESLVHKHNLTDHIHHHGSVSDRARIKELHLQADAFVLPTYYPTEAQPSSIIEALSAATPIITCNQGGIAGMVRPEEDALFVPKESPSAIADSIISLTQPDRWQHYSKQSRRRYLALFDPKSIKYQWEELIVTVAQE